MNNCSNDCLFVTLRGYSIIKYSVFVGLRVSFLILIHSAIFTSSICAVSLSSAWFFEDIVISASFETHVGS